MRRLFLITLGFHEDHVIRRLVNDKTSKNDRVVLVTASPIASATQRAYESLVAVCGRMGLPKPEIIGIPADPYEGLKILINLLSGDNDVVLDLSGGMRYLSVYTLMALLLMRREGRVYLQPESGEVSEVVIPETLIKAFFNPLKPVEVELMKLIKNSEGLTTRDLARLSGKSEKTVMNLLSNLSKKGLVVRRGRAGGTFLTPAGRLLLEIMR
ncbi:MAG: CRISPR-associated CARF protein Csa3 [Zestosphaera sp.]